MPVFFVCFRDSINTAKSMKGKKYRAGCIWQLNCHSLTRCHLFLFFVLTIGHLVLAPVIALDI